MTPLLLDTHAFLWFVFDDERLSDAAANAIADPDREQTLSIASLWEITIKRQLGKLELGMELAGFFTETVQRRLLRLLPLELDHLTAYDRLPLHHRDPFDRLLVAQAAVLGAPIVTADPSFDAYGVDVVW